MICESEPDGLEQGMDLPDIEIVVQWKATCDLCTFWQWFGCVACGQDIEGTAILLVEKKDTNKEWAAKAERVVKRKRKIMEGIGTTRKRKIVDQGGHKGAKKGITSCVLTDINQNQLLMPP